MILVTIMVKNDVHLWKWWERDCDQKKSMPKVVWELDVIGDEEKFDTNDEVELAVNQTLAEYLAEAQEVSFRLLHHQNITCQVFGLLSLKPYSFPYPFKWQMQRWSSGRLASHAISLFERPSLPWRWQAGADCRLPSKIETLKDAPAPVVAADQGWWEPHLNGDHRISRCPKTSPGWNLCLWWSTGGLSATLVLSSLSASFKYMTMTIRSRSQSPT